jgi:hypothetical protein
MIGANAKDLTRRNPDRVGVRLGCTFGYDSTLGGVGVDSQTFSTKEFQNVP